MHNSAIMVENGTYNKITILLSEKFVIAHEFLKQKHIYIHIYPHTFIYNCWTMYYIMFWLSTWCNTSYRKCWHLSSINIKKPWSLLNSYFHLLTHLKFFLKHWRKGKCSINSQLLKNAFPKWRSSERNWCWIWTQDRWWPSEKKAKHLTRCQMIGRTVEPLFSHLLLVCLFWV